MLDHKDILGPLEPYPQAQHSQLVRTTEKQAQIVYFPLLLHLLPPPLHLQLLLPPPQALLLCLLLSDLGRMLPDLVTTLLLLVT